MTYLEACRKVLDAITDAEANIAADQLNPVATLTISAPVLFGQRYVAPLVNAFALRYPASVSNGAFLGSHDHVGGVGVRQHHGHRRSPHPDRSGK